MSNNVVPRYGTSAVRDIIFETYYFDRIDNIHGGESVFTTRCILRCLQNAYIFVAFLLFSPQKFRTRSRATRAGLP